ncbi:MAG: hypothetical protein PSN46_06030 [Gammaproteobacteria bacterium]|nr:hypothetical protein [Gammaproteobacteria bacterium]
MKQQGFKSARALPILLAVMLLTACSANPFLSNDGDSILRDKSLDYAQSEVIDRIVIPEGLDSSYIQKDLLTVPVAQLGEQAAGIVDAPRPDFVFAQAGSESARLTGNVLQKRISVTGNLTKVQGQVAQFWANQGIAIDTVSNANVIETQWFSLSEKGPSNDFISRWIRGLTKSDDDVAHGRVKVELQQTDTNRVELSLYFLQFTQLEITQQRVIDWQEAGRTLANESEITFELLRYLSRTAQVAQKTKEYSQQDQLPLLGKDQHGRPLVQINMSFEQALPNVLKAMSTFDVGSHDRTAKKIYFTHVSHLRTSEDTTRSSGIWGWFKGLHSGKAREPGISLDLALMGGKDNVEQVEQPIYSSNPDLATEEISLADKKGYKIWLGGEVIYVFEDDDQGDVSDLGEYTYVGRYQLSFEETLKSVYLQVLSEDGLPAAKVYAEEILWKLQHHLSQ